jgi:ubiquinone/menaquinone biosynthesis C-methylase UbiE
MSNKWSKHVESWLTYIRSYGEGAGFPSREWFASYIDPNDVILDVGCAGATEAESLFLHHPKLKYIGVDFTPEAIVAAKVLFPGADFRVDDARTLSTIPDASVDVVLIRHTLDHIDKWEDALRAAWRVARKEVVIILWPTCFPDYREPTFKELEEDVYFRMFSRPFLIEWLEKELGAKVEDFEIKITGVPGREHRIDTVFIARKK